MQQQTAALIFPQPPLPPLDPSSQPPPQFGQPPQQQQPWMMMPPPPQYQPAAGPPPPQMWTPQHPLSAAPPPQALAPPAIQSQPFAIPNANAAPVMSSDEIRSLWIGDLQYWMDENYLFGCFAATGEVVSVKVIRNKQTQFSEGYGFIEFVNRAAAERTLATYNGTLMPQSEQAFRLNWASLGAGQRRQDDTPDHTIFVGDLAADVTDLVLQEAFHAHYPSVKGAKVITDHVTGRSKGYGFVKFADEAEQQRAMNEMNGAILSTRPMRIGPASNRKPAITPQNGHQEALITGAWN